MKLSVSEKYGDHYRELHGASQLAQQVTVPSLVRCTNDLFSGSEKVLDRRPNLVYNNIANDAYQSLMTRHRLAYLTKKGGKHAQLKDFGSSIGSSSQLMRWAILDLLILFICAVSRKGFGG